MKINFFFFFFVGILVIVQSNFFKNNLKNDDFDLIFVKDHKGDIIKYKNKTNLVDNHPFSISICAKNEKYLKTFQKTLDYDEKFIMRMCKITRNSIHLCKDLNENDWEDSKKLMIKSKKNKYSTAIELTLKKNSGVSLKAMISYIKKGKNMSYSNFVEKFSSKTLKEKLFCFETELKDSFNDKKEKKNTKGNKKKEQIDDMKPKFPIFKRTLQDRNIVNFFIFNLQELKNEKQIKFIKKIMETIYKRH